MIDFLDSVEDSSSVKAIEDYVRLNNIQHVMCDLFETLFFPSSIKEDFLFGQGRISKLSRVLLRIIHSLTLRISKQELSATSFGRFVWKMKQMDSISNPNDFLPRSAIILLIKNLIADGVSVDVVTNTMWKRQDLEKMLRSVGLQGCNLFTSGEMRHIKSQGLFRQVMSNNNMPLEKTIVIGDDAVEDEAAGQDVGLKTFLIPKISDLIQPVLTNLQLKNLCKNRNGLQLVQAFSSKFSCTPSLNYGYAVGFFYSGLMSIVAANKVNQICDRYSLTDRVFLSREGYLVDQACRTFKNDHALNSLRNHYLYSSRHLLTSPDGLEYVKKQLGYFNLSSKTLFFDVGWRGRLLGNVADLHKSASYLVMIGIWPWIKPPARLHTVYFSRSKLFTALSFRRCPEILEFLLAAPHEHVTTPQIMMLPINSVQTSLILGARQTFELAKPHNNFDSLAFPLIKQLLSHPSIEQASLFGKILHSVHGETPSTLVTINEDGRILWLKGSKKLETTTSLQRCKEVWIRIGSLINRI